MYSLQNSDYFKLRELARLYNKHIAREMRQFYRVTAKNELNTQMKSLGGDYIQTNPRL